MSIPGGQHAVADGIDGQFMQGKSDVKRGVWIEVRVLALQPDVALRIGAVTCYLPGYELM